MKTINRRLVPVGEAMKELDKEAMWHMVVSEFTNKK
jgi:hypothetical protein